MVRFAGDDFTGNAQDEFIETEIALMASSGLSYQTAVQYQDLYQPIQREKLHRSV